MNTLRRNFHPRLLLLLGLLFLPACLSQASADSTIITTDPKPIAAYVFVTANPAPTRTPFQPSQPTATPPATATATLTATPTSTSTPLPTLTATLTSTLAASPTGVPSATMVVRLPDFVERPQYTLSASMDYAGHIVSVNETVIYPNLSQDSFVSIPLGVNSNLWSGVFSLQAISVNDQPSFDYSLSGQRLIINLGSPLEPGAAVKLGISYLLNLPYGTGKVENFGYTFRQTNLVDWYPFVPPYINGQWVLPDPYSYGENLVYDKADFQVSLTFADPSSAPVVAAPAPGVYENGVLTYNLQNARNFTLSASSEYQFSTADANGITIYSYYFPSSANAAAMVLELTRMAVITYSSEFGPYPHVSLTVCETDLNDGLETDGLYFLASSFYQGFDGTVRNNLSTIAVHETAHQWWYGAVANNQAEEPWLDEALSTCSEHFFYETNYPDLLDWWWNFRIYSHGATGWVDTRIYDSASFRGYVSAVYFNGAEFLQALRDRLGDDVFRGFIRDYYTRSNGRIVTANDFFGILSLNSNLDISDLVSSYFRYR